jgi:transcription elongation factor greA
MKNTTKIYLSKQGFKELKKKITKLEHEQKMLEMELRDGDIKEDLLRQNDIFARIDAIRSEINEKNFQIHNSKILPRSRKISSKVSIGSFVELFDRATGRIMKFRIVESLEANPLIGKISSESPLGKSVLGRTVNEIISWTANSQSMNMTLVAIR